MRPLRPLLLLGIALPGCVTEEVLYRIPEPIPGLGWDLDAPTGTDGEGGTGSAGDTGAPIPCDDAGTWATTGQPLMLTWCTGCHSAHLEGAGRHGAPDDVNLDSLGGFAAHADRALARMEAGTMPAGGGLSTAELRRIRAWVDCGMDGSEAALDGTAPEAGPVDGAVVRSQVAGDGVSVEVRTDRAELFGDATYGRVLTESFLMDAGDAWLVGWSWERSDGVWEEAFDPPVPLTSPTAAWSHTTTVTRTTPAGTETATEVWSLSVEPATDVDPRAPDPSPDRLLALVDTGAEHGWHLSAPFGVAQRWAFTAGGDGLVILQALDQGESSWAGFPLRTGDAWRARYVAYGALP